MQSIKPLFQWIGVGGILLMFFAAATSGSDGDALSTTVADSIGAQIDLQREGDQLSVRGLFAGDAAAGDTLTYELAVRRSGTAGTTQSTQSGAFAPTPGGVDTLSTVRVSVETGDRLRLHLTVLADGAPVDSVRIERTIS